MVPPPASTVHRPFPLFAAIPVPTGGQRSALCGNFGRRSVNAVRSLLSTSNTRPQSPHRIGRTSASEGFTKERVAAVDGFVAEFVVAGSVGVDLAQPDDPPC